MPPSGLVKPPAWLLPAEAVLFRVCTAFLQDGRKQS